MNGTDVDGTDTDETGTNEFLSETSVLMPHRDPPRLWVNWLTVVLGGVLLAWVTGRLEPRFVPDSPSYQNYSFESLSEICRSIRTPGYPAWLTLIVGTVGLSLVPLCQVIVHATATCWFWYELRAWGLSRVQTMVAAFAIAVGCTPMDHINVVSTDALAASLGIMTAVALMRSIRLSSIRDGGTLSASILSASLAVITIAVRPAYLFLIPWVLIAGSLLSRRSGLRWSRAFRKGGVAALLVLMPVVGWMTVRYVTVGDFAIAPFGHQNLGGILVQLVSEDELNELGDLGRTIAKKKQQYVSTLGESASDNPRATMTIDARWDAMTYHVVIPAAREVVGENIVESHRAIGSLNRAIVSNWPGRYLIWIAKAIRRGAWAIAADIVMHPIFLPLILLALILTLYRSVVGDLYIPVTSGSPALDALTIVAITYLFTKLGFISLSSPPIGRFSDAAAIFLPALLAAGFVRWYSRFAG